VKTGPRVIRVNPDNADPWVSWDLQVKREPRGKRFTGHSELPAMTEKKESPGNPEKGVTWAYRALKVILVLVFRLWVHPVNMDSVDIQVNTHLKFKFLLSSF
jgi:hypothetical protein